MKSQPQGLDLRLGLPGFSVNRLPGIEPGACLAESGASA